MWGPGGLSCIIRFICHVPTGFAGINGLITYNNVRGLGDILNGTATFAWNFFQFAVSPFLRGNLLAITGLVDLALAGLLVAGVVLERRFLPGTFSGCNGASNWNNATDGRNFFVVANGTDAFGSDGPNSICHNIVQIWVMAIVVIILYLLCGVFNILLGFGGVAHSGPGSRTAFGLPPQYDIDLFGWMFGPLRCLLKPVVYVYKHLRASLYFACRYVSKYMSRKKKLTLRPTKHLRPPKNAKGESGNHGGPRLPLELAIMIVRELHYADLVNLSRSSKALRAVFFGSRSPEQAMKDLRPFVCGGEISCARCAVCKIQICPGCEHRALIPLSGAFRHLRACRPACSRCFYKNHCVQRVTPADYARARGSSTRRQFDPSWVSELRRYFQWARQRFRSSRNVETNSVGAYDVLDEAICQNCATLWRREMLAEVEAESLRELQL
ncbi:da038d89-998d-401d-ba4c-a4be060dff2c [Thermothielavioides terrestris]|uniref:Da038d89-998d-401d-ba4c-a4be060dff2c n=1 Tax=Thermothielavioides terrestris TaxID=2587410 RepID=A0A446BPM1_9PEZI|nr:da038d89-998d-401d-ba4c-a4be060dff2c [Thermothielavioides terrestris]